MHNKKSLFSGIKIRDVFCETMRSSLLHLSEHFGTMSPNPCISFSCCVSCSYVVNMGLIDKLYGCFLSIQSPVDEHPKMSAFLQQASALLYSMCKLCFVVTGR